MSEIDSVVHDQTTYTAFHGSRRVAQGSLREVAAAVKLLEEENPGAGIRVFADQSGQVVDLDRRVAEQYTPPRTATTAVALGRPKLGVIGREVTLLARHWDWLGMQPGGASAAIRRLVDDARTNTSSASAIRIAQEATYKFLFDMAGDEPGFEEAIRALYRKDQERFNALIQHWPGDIPAYGKQLAANAFGGGSGSAADEKV
ncbi:MAG: DUF2239 family protein [Candidatus Methylacidiphilales bacterium]|nr:DUF2239 family protein [Candidatus Methylacidiphilales bacterium]